MNFKNLIPVFILLMICVNVNAFTIRTNFYDENSLSAIPTVTITDSNGSVYTSDVNGLWTASLTGAKSFDISKAGYATRPFDFNFTADANYNFLLNSTTLDSNIGFIAKDTNNNLWTNKYLMFRQDANKYSNISLNSYLPVSSAGASTNFKFIALKNFRLDSITFRAGATSTTTITVGACSIASATYTSNVLYTVNFTNCNLIAGTTYTVASSSGNTFIVSSDPYSSNMYISSVVSEYSLLKTSSGTFNQSIAVSPITNTNPTIINSILTSSTGTATGTLAPAGDYNALLYDSNGTLNTTYQKTTVTVNKPLNEKTAVAISPFDIYVSGLLQYNLTNQTASSVPFNIFAGTDSYYTFTAVDYNVLTANQKYIPKSYFVQVPLGTGYSQALTYTPYLLLKTDGIVPKVIVIDKLNRTVENAQIYVSKYIGGVLTIVESGNTFANGVFNFSAYPLDVYYISVYYNGIPQGVYSVQPRESTDEFWIQIDRTTFADIEQELLISLDDSATPRYIERDTNLTFLATINSNLDYITDYNVNMYVGTTKVYSSNTVDSGLSIDINELIDMSGVANTVTNVKIEIIVNYAWGTDTGSRTFYKSIVITDGGDRLLAIENAKNEVGQPLAVLLAIIITMAMLAFIIFSGVITEPPVIAILGLLIMGFFMIVGFLDMGVSIIGLDIGRFVYILGAIATLYMAFFGGR